MTGKILKNTFYTLGILLTGISTCLRAQHPADSFPIMDLCQVNLNRTATKLSAANLSTVSPAILGFKWQTDDATTLKWRPQGITALNKACKKFVAVSWYGRYINNPFPCNGQNADYRDRGSRVSFVDVSNPDSMRYRHVLLVDENYNTFYDMHAGGILVVNDTLYVPDSRGSNDAMYVFPLDQIKQIPASFQSSFYNYGYLLARVPPIDSLPINPSFLAYDWDDQKIVAGAFQNCDPVNCNNPAANTLMWYRPGNVNRYSPFYDDILGKMQGLGSADTKFNNGKKDIWVSTSYGASNNSELYTFNYDFGINNQQNQSISIGNNYAVFDLPPGLEDIHLSSDNDTIWTLTEFSPNHPVCLPNSSNERYVFAFLRTDIHPPGACVDTIQLQQYIVSDSSLCSPDSLSYVASTNYVAYAQFDKSDNTWVELNSLSSPLSNSNRSVFMWVKQNTAVSTESQVLLGINTASGGNICNLQVNTSQQLGIYDGATAHYGNTIITDGQWHHVGYTYNENTGMTRIYVDGQNEFSFTDAQTVTASSLFSLGQEFDSGLSSSNFLEGILTEVTIWNEVLTAADIALLRQATVQYNHPNINKLLAYYPMHVSCGDDLTILKDISGNNYHGKGYGTIGTNGIDILSVERIEAIHGFDAVDHFDVQWLQGGNLLSNSKQLLLTAGNYTSGLYQMKLNRMPFEISDYWIIDFDYSYGIDTLAACDSLVWIDGISYSQNDTSATYTLNNSLGCDSIVRLHLTINTIDTNVLISGITATAQQANASYQWIDCNNNSAIAGANNQSYSPTQSGSYAVSVSLNNCTHLSDCIDISLTGNASIGHETIIVYPNPSNGTLRIDTDLNIKLQDISLNRLNGKGIAFKMTQNNGHIILKFDAVAGIYLLKIASDSGYCTTKIIVN